MPVSLELQITAIELRRLALKDRLERRPKNWPETDNERASQQIEHLAAAVATLRWLQRHEARIKAALTGDET